MDTKHTPGPWEVTTGAFEIAGRINGKPAVDIAYHVIAEHQTGMQARANAHLIAAAPCLMEALGLLLDTCDMESLDGPIVRKARAALAKATNPAPPR